MILQRYRDRSESGTRHPGHVDNVVYAELERELESGGYQPLDIAGEVCLVDTTDFARVDNAAIYAKIRRFLHT